jgi:ankyrin repeat protein
MGSQSAQSLVYRFHIALDQTIPAGNTSRIKQWVIDAAMRGYPAALEDVHLLASAEECSFVIGKLRRRYAGIGHNRFAFLYAGVDVPFDQWDLKMAEIIEERFKLHPQPEYFTLGMKHGDNIIHFAASAGLRNTINLWRQPRPIDINCKGDEDETALLHAARSGHYEVTMAILEMGGDPTIASTNGDTPLHWLLSYDAEHVVEIASQFCLRGANPNAIAKPVHLNFAPECTYESGTPLHRAVERGNLDAVRALLSVGARADDEGGRGYTPLNLAAFLHRSEILESLLSSLSAAQPAMGVYANMSLLAPAVGGEFFHGEKFSKIARHGASWWSQTASTLDILIAQGADKHLHGLPEGSMGAGVTALFLATTQGDARCVQYFLEHGCKSDVNVKSQYEPTATPRTPLNKAISSRRTESAIMLLKYGADPLALHIDENNDELTSVYECASAGHSDTIIVEQLVLAGAPVDDPGPSNYETPFACAVRNRSFVLASWLLKQGANPNIEYNKGFMFEMGFSRTLLGVLIMEQSLSTLACINFLVENVPETNFIVASIQGYTALHAVSQIREHGRDNIAVHLILLRLLEFFKPTIEQVNQLSLDGYTALHFAVSTANFDVVRKLVEKGADPNVKDASGLSPKDIINLTYGDVEEDPDTYIDATDSRPRGEQIILVKNRREKILHLFEGHRPKTHGIVE